MIKLENEAFYQAEDVILLHFKKEEKPLKINLIYAHRIVTKDYAMKKFVKLEDKPNTEEIFQVMRNKINYIERVDNMFVAYGKTKIKPLNKEKIKLRVISQ